MTYKQCKKSRTSLRKHLQPEPARSGRQSPEGRLY